MTNINERPKRERREDCVSGLQGPAIRCDDINRHERTSEVRSRQFISFPTHPARLRVPQGSALRGYALSHRRLANFFAEPAMREMDAGDSSQYEATLFDHRPQKVDE